MILKFIKFLVSAGAEGQLGNPKGHTFISSGGVVLTRKQARKVVFDKILVELPS